MAATAEQGETRYWETTPILNPEQMRQIMASLSGGIRKPKVKKPEIYRGERHKLQSWLGQRIVYYRTVGLESGHDKGKI